MNIKDRLTAVAENVPRVYNAGASDFGLKESAEGSLVTFGNVHPKEHKVSVGLSSKNLFNKAEANITETEDRFSSNITYWQNPCLTIPVESGTAYYFSCEIYTPGTTQFNQIIAFSLSTEKTYTTAAKALILRLKTENSTKGFSATYGTFTVPEGIEEIYFLTNADNTFFKNFQIKKGTTATAYTPYIADFSDCKVKVSGKNVCSLETPYNIDETTRLVLWESDIPQYIGFIWDVTIESVQHAGSAAVWKFTREDGSVFYDISYATLNIGKITPEKVVKVEIVNYALIVGIINNIQLEIGTTPTDYEPYKAAEYTADAEGAVEGVKRISPVMNLSTDTAGVEVKAECFLDPVAVREELTNAILTLGGEI